MGKAQEDTRTTNFYSRAYQDTNSLTALQVLPDLFNIPLPDTIMPVAPIYDEELATFFSGYEYRYDILDKIDHEVARLASALYHGEKVTFGERKLVAYALFANVVDTYKVENEASLPKQAMLAYTPTVLRIQLPEGLASPSLLARTW